MAQLVRIDNYYGRTVIATVLEEVAEGILHGWNYLQMPDGEKCYIATRWCVPCTADGKPLTQDGCVSGHTIAADSQDTDWRKFLHDHWDTEHNHCKVEYLEAFMVIFRRAAAAYIKKQAPKPVEPKEPQPVASVSFAEAVPQPKPTPKKKPRYVQLSLFD